MTYENLCIGTGFDAHKFVSGRELVLGGIRIDFPLGLAGHSDADVLLHAVTDALLGAASLGDIGRLFPDTEPAYKNISSLELLKRVYALLTKNRIRIVNIDTVIICEEPKISAYAEAMKECISQALGGLAVSRIGIKGTTTEGLGFAGRGEGIAAQASALCIREA